MKWVPVIAVVVAMALGLGACTTEAARICGPIINDELDPLSDQHVLPTAQITYLQDPPTSGPHLSAAPPSGVIDVTISPAVQVTALEAGSVIIQYDAAIDPGGFLAFAGDDVVIAPADSLPAAVVFTAWQTRQECTGFDTASARSFIRDHAGRGPSHS